MEIELRPAKVEALVGVVLMLEKLNPAYKVAIVSAWVVEQERCTHASREEADELLEKLKVGMETQEFEKAAATGRKMNLEQILDEVNL